MKIYAVSDIHADNRKYRTVFDLPRRIQEKIDKDTEKSILIICGDVAQNIVVFHRFLKMFKMVPIPKLFVAGNHDLWVENVSDSLVKYLITIKEACSDAGFHYLDQEPFIEDKIGFVGNVGWYDYSFKTSHTNIPEGMHLIKGSTSQYIQWEDLQDEDYELKTLLGEIDNNLFNITTWNDKLYIHWRFSDKEFTQRCLNQIQNQLAQVRNKINHLVFCSHHIHFQECILHKNKVQWDFNNAFMGSREIGETILNEEKLRLFLFGHSHKSGKYTLKNSIPAFNVSYQPNDDFTCIQINSIDGSVSQIS